MTTEPGAPSPAAQHPAAPSGARFLGLIALGAVLGIPASLLAWAFLGLVHWFEDLLWQDLPAALGTDSPPWYLLLGLPVVGAAVVFAARELLPGDGGHDPLGGIGGAPTPWRYAPGVMLAALGTLPFGAVLGPEAPLIALGSALGMIAVSAVRATGPAEQVLATAGSFAAVSALFGGPLVAGILLLEAGLAAGVSLIPALLPGLVAAAVGYLVFIGLGDWGGLGAMSLAVPDLPDYSGTRFPDLLLGAAVGLLVGLLTWAVRRGAGALSGAASTTRYRRGIALAGGGLAVGAVGLAAQALGADYREVLFSGQSGIPLALADTSVAILLVVIVAKAVAYAISLGCGFRGGPVFPAIFLGVAIAAIFCLWFDIPITWAVAVGTAAGMAGGTGLVFSGLMFALLLCGTAGLDALPAAVFASVAAWLTRQALG